MAFDGIVVANLVHELREHLLNGRIARIAQPETDELLLTVKTADGQKRLLISANASLPLIYLSDKNKPSPMTAPNFCMLRASILPMDGSWKSPSQSWSGSSALPLNIWMTWGICAGKS